MTLLDRPAPTVADLVARLQDDRPAFHAGGTRTWYALPGTLELIADHAAGCRSLETGAGASTLVCAAVATTHTAISPSSDEHRRIRRYAEEVGVDTGHVTFVAGPSDRVLPTLDERVGFAFVDGKHSFPHPVVDFHYAQALLEPGGVLVLDDVPIPAVGVVWQHVHRSPDWAAVGMADDRAAAFRKLADAEDDDNWHLQAFNRGYPDFSFAAPHHRAALEAREAVGRLRRRLGAVLGRPPGP
jgi:predicted O-methyltransferase YrrM